MCRKITSHWQPLFSKKMAAAASFSYKIGGDGLIFLQNWWRRPHFPTKLAAASLSNKIGSGGGKDLATLLAAVLTWSGYWTSPAIISFMRERLVGSPPPHSEKTTPFQWFRGFLVFLWRVCGTNPTWFRSPRAHHLEVPPRVHTDMAVCARMHILLVVVVVSARSRLAYVVVVSARSRLAYVVVVSARSLLAFFHNWGWLLALFSLFFIKYFNMNSP